MAYSTKEILQSVIDAYNSNEFRNSDMEIVITQTLKKYDKSSVHNNAELCMLWNELDNIHTILTVPEELSYLIN